MRLTCVKSGYNIPLNTFNTQIPNGNYILDVYINKINNAFKLWEDGENNDVNVVDASLTLINSYPTVRFNILKEFTEVDYNIVLSSSVFFRGNFLGFDTSYNNNYSPTSNIAPFSTLDINDNNRTIILQPKNNSSVGNYLAAPIAVLLTKTGQLTLSNLFASINTDFANSEYMKGSNISYVQNEGTFLLTLILNVSVKLTSNDYNASFIDTNGNSWNNNFGISFEPYALSLNNPVIGTKSIFNNLITLSTLNNNNQIIFRPVNPVLTGGNDIIFEIPSLTYTRSELIEKINTLFYQNPITRNSTITVDNNNISTIKMTINKTYTSADFKLVFYDIFSFVYCNVGVSNVRNVKWDTTLGWTLGFHTYTEYNLSEFAKLGPGQISSSILEENYQNYFNNIYGQITESNSKPFEGDIANTDFIVDQATYTNSNSSDGRLAIIGDSVCNTNLYNYFLLIIDDFIQNHVNDGLITIATVENDLVLPSYASRVSYQCDPITGQKIAGISTNNQFTALTAKQLYSMNQIIEARRSSSTYTAGPYMRDVFGLIPIKLAGLSFGSTYMEFGGTLQNQNRKYFGPVNIKKMSIKLMNDRGDVVDLNGTNWSVTLICEILNTAT